MNKSKNSLRDWQENQEFGPKLPLKKRMDYVPELSENENYEERN